MNVAEGWNMYLEIHDLKKKHFNVSQISRRLDLSRTTVYKYLDMTPEEMEQVLAILAIDMHCLWAVMYQIKE